MRWLLYSLLIVLLCGCASCGDSPRQATLPYKMTTQDKEAMIEMNRQLIESDDTTIQRYIETNRLPMQSYKNGAYGMISQNGTGIYATDGRVVTIKTTITLLDGQVCYKDTSIAFIPGKTIAISGLHQIAAQWQKGTKASYIFPPALAYGIYGDGKQIPPRSILRYDIEVINVKESK